MQILSPEETRAVLSRDRLIEAIGGGFKAVATCPLRHHHHMRTEAGPDDVILPMQAWRDEGWRGSKLVNVHPGNSDNGLPAISSTYLLFDRETGRHKLILDGGELTARRTAVASALAAKKLARADSRRLKGAGIATEDLGAAILALETVGSG